MPGFICRRMPDTYRRQSAPGGVQIDKTRPRPEPGKKFKPRKPRGKCTLLRAGGAEQAPRGTGAYCVFPLPRTPTLPQMHFIQGDGGRRGMMAVPHCRSPDRKRGKESGRYEKSEPPAKRVVCSGPIRAYYRLRLKTLAFTLFKPSALAALTTP